MTPLEKVVHALRERKLTLSAAESCTGGLLSHLLTNVPGISEHFLGGIVSYSNQAKRDLLKVREDVLRDHGPVSVPCVLAMAHGCRDAFKSDLAVAITGIAGPGGGTPDKPVGLILVAIADSHGAACRRYMGGDDRRENKRGAAQAALEMLADRLEATKE